MWTAACSSDSGSETAEPSGGRGGGGSNAGSGAGGASSGGNGSSAGGEPGAAGESSDGGRGEPASSGGSGSGGEPASGGADSSPAEGGSSSGGAGSSGDILGSCTNMQVFQCAEYHYQPDSPYPRNIQGTSAQSTCGGGSWSGSGCSTDSLVGWCEGVLASYDAYYYEGAGMADGLSQACEALQGTWHEP